MTVNKDPMVYAKRKDKNHLAAVKVVGDAGYFSHDTNVTGNGFPDLLVVSRVDPRIVVLFEIKVGDKPLQDKEVKFFAVYPGLAFVVCSKEGEGYIAGHQIVDIMRKVESEECHVAAISYGYNPSQAERP